jgi:hypothetical protein
VGRRRAKPVETTAGDPVEPEPHQDQRPDFVSGRAWSVPPVFAVNGPIPTLVPRSSSSLNALGAQRFAMAELSPSTRQRMGYAKSRL